MHMYLLYLIKLYFQRYLCFNAFCQTSYCFLSVIVSKVTILQVDKNYKQNDKTSMVGKAVVSSAVPSIILTL